MTTSMTITTTTPPPPPSPPPQPPHLCDIVDGHGLVRGLVGRENGRVSDEGEVDARVRHQVGLELGQVDVESAVEPQRRRDRGDDLTDHPVQIRESGWMRMAR